MCQTLHLKNLNSIFLVPTLGDADRLWMRTWGGGGCNLMHWQHGLKLDPLQPRSQGVT